jgi:amino acid permease
MLRVGKVIGTAIGSAWLVYVVVAVAGFITYGDLVKSDILNNYPHTSVAAVARVAITLLVIFSYPLQLNPARKCILSLVQSVTFGGRFPTPAGGRPTGVQEHYIITCTFLLLSLCVAFATEDLGIILVRCSFLEGNAVLEDILLRFAPR